MMTNFHKILVAIDDSKSAERVFERGLALAEQNQAELVIFHGMNMQRITDAMPLMGTGIGIDLASSKAIFEFQQKQLQAQSKTIQATLDRYRQQAEAQNISAETAYRIGDPGAWICDLAQAMNVDLIVMGRRGFCGLKEVFLGSVSNYVMHQATCSVMVVQGHEPESELVTESAPVTT